MGAIPPHEGAVLGGPRLDLYRGGARSRSDVPGSDATRLRSCCRAWGKAKALDELQAAVDLQPNYDDAYRLRGEILARLGRWDEAFQSLQKAIDVRPNYWGNYRSLGLAYRDAGRLDSALTAFQRIVDLVPDNAWGYQLLGTIYQQQGRLVDARLQYETACSTAVRRRRSRIWAICITPRAPTPTRCACSRRRRSCVPARPPRSETSATRCDACGATAMPATCTSVRQRSPRRRSRVNPGDAHAHAAAAVYLGKLGRFDAAERHLREAQAAGLPDAEVWYRSAVVRSLNGQRAQAIVDLERAVAAGYSPELIRSDDDLTLLRREPKFMALMAARAAAKRSIP